MLFIKQLLCIKLLCVRVRLQQKRVGMLEAAEESHTVKKELDDARTAVEEPTDADTNGVSDSDSKAQKTQEH